MITVQILGVSGYYKTNHLKSNVLKALKELNLEAKVEEISDLEEMIRSDISATPALRVNGKIVMQQIIPGVEELKSLLKVLIQPYSSHFQYSKILVPTDYSPTANGAWNFALKLATQHDTSLKLVHVYHPENDPVYPYLQQASKDYLEEKKKEMNAFVQKSLPNDPGYKSPEVEKKILAGSAAERIIELSKGPYVNFIIMGTTGKGGLLEKVFGSVSVQVAQNAYCPVLLVPEGVTFNGFKKILYASNHPVSDESMLQPLADFANLFGSEIHFVHIKTEKQNGYIVKNKHFEKHFREKAPELHFNSANVPGKDAGTGLAQYATDNDIDLMVLATNHRNFLENLFHKSLTKRIVQQSEIPLMIMHFEP